METRTTRRYFLFGSIACLGGLPFVRHLKATTLTPGATVPTVDSLSIKVLMDSSHDWFLRAERRKRSR
jgi:hypothetical protein